MPELITSFSNPLVRRVKSLAERKYRRREGCFVVEGLQPVWRAVTSDWTIDTLVVAPDLLTNDDARGMVAQQSAQGVRVAEVSSAVFARLSGRDGPAGLLAIVRGVIGGLAEFRPRDGAPILALDRPGNPGNIGTLIRTADAAGAGGVVVLGHAADALAPAAVKASMGSLFALPIAHGSGGDDLLDWASRGGRTVVAVTGHASETLYTARIPDDAVLLLGSEGAGLDDGLTARCDLSVAIPMTGTAESLNLATAGSIALYELARRRYLEERA